MSEHEHTPDEIPEVVDDLHSPDVAVDQTPIPDTEGLEPEADEEDLA